jgi:hypothetical protein
MRKIFSGRAASTAWTRLVVLALLAGAVIAPRAAAQQPTGTLDSVIDRIVAQEKAETEMLREYTPLVETYIQHLQYDKDQGLKPGGDTYFLGRAQLKDGVALVSFTEDKHGASKKTIAKILSGAEFPPESFLQLVHVDRNGFDREHYSFDFVRREFLGEIRCLVFDIRPQPKAGKNRFAGRIWVEDEGFHIVRFNGGNANAEPGGRTFHFDSWRMNSGHDQWLPTLIYTEANDNKKDINSRLVFKGQTRLWAYSLSTAQQSQELDKLLAEDSPKGKPESAGDATPLQAEMEWNKQAEQNVLDRLEHTGLLAPRGEVDQVLDTVINNLEVTNDLDVDVHSRVLMTSTLEAFTVGHTLLLSRGLIDVLPDEASLAVMLARELSHVVLGHHIDSQYGFFDQLVFDDKETFRHWGFARPAEEEKAAMEKAVQLLNKSPYKTQLGTAQKFLAALDARAKDIPNLISPHLGDQVPTTWTVAAEASSSADVTVALPIGGRIKFDPWSNQLFMLKAKPVRATSERELMAFELTPVLLNLSRQNSIGAAPAATTAETQTNTPAPPSRKQK